MLRIRNWKTLSSSKELVSEPVLSSSVVSIVQDADYFIFMRIKLLATSADTERIPKVKYFVH